MLSFLSTKATSAAPMLTATLGTPHRYGIPNYSAVPAAELEMRYGRWVYKCANINGNFAASIPLRLFSMGKSELVEKCPRLRARKLDARTKAFLHGRLAVQPAPNVMKRITGQQDDMTEIMEHPILDLFNRVNPVDTGFSFRQATFRDMDLFGETYWHIVEKGGVPVELWRMLPKLMRIFPSPSAFVDHYEYGRGIATVNYKPEEVLRFWMPDPGNPWGAFGPTAAWLKSIDADFAMVAFQEDMFQRGGSPDWLISSKAGWSDQQKKTFIDSWRAKFGRWLRRREHLALIDGEITATKISDSPKELDYNASQIAKRNEIFNAFDVPITFAEPGGVVANSREGMNHYKTLAIWPRTRRVEEVINQNFVWVRWSERLVLVFDYPLEDDPVVRVNERKSKLESGWSVDEVRAEDGEEAVEGGDVPMVGSNVIPLSMAGMGGLGVGIGAATGMPSKDGTAGQPDGQSPAQTPEQVQAGTQPQTIEAGQIETSAATVQLNGAQVTAATAIVIAVAAGELPRDAGIGQLEVLFNLTAEQAERIMGSAGTSKPTTPNPNPAEEARLEAEQEAAAARNAGGAVAGRNPPAAGSPPAKAPEKSAGGYLFVGPGAAEMGEAVKAKLCCYHALGLDGQMMSSKAEQHHAWSTKDKKPEPQSKLPPIGKFAERIGRVFSQQARALNGALTDQASAELVDTLLSDPKWTEQIVEAARPYVESAVATGGKTGMNRLTSMGADVDPFQVANPVVQQFVDEYTVRLANGVNDYTRVQLRSLIGDGLEQGESIADLKKRVQEWASDVGDAERGLGYRAENIARTESARAYVAGQEQAWLQSGVVTGKKWLLAHDACEFCQAAADHFGAMSVPLGRSFYAQGSTLRGADGGSMMLDYSDVDGPPLHPQCYLPNTPVLARGIVAAYSAIYDGQAIEVTMADGRTLAVTANHMFLTPHGFVAAKSLRKGDHVIRQQVRNGVGSRDPHRHNAPPMIQEIVGALAVSSGVSRLRVPVAPEYLHGDGRFCDRYVDVVTMDRFFRNRSKPIPTKRGDQLPLCAVWDSVKLASLGDFDAMLVGLSRAAHSIMGRANQLHPASGTCMLHAREHGLATVTRDEAHVGHATLEREPVTADLIGECLDAFPGLVTANKVADVRHFHFSGHVYDLQTESGLTIGNGIVTSNCRCDVIPVLASEADNADR